MRSVNDMIIAGNTNATSGAPSFVVSAAISRHIAEQNNEKGTTASYIHLRGHHQAPLQSITMCRSQARGIPDMNNNT